jgi:glycosyltransferase involved in cell wall biosynthesis
MNELVKDAVPDHRKRIAHVTFDMSIGGAEQVIYQIIENRDRRRFDVSILCLNKPMGAFGNELAKKGYDVFVFGRRPGLDVKLISWIRKYISRNKVDILHCHQYTPYVYGVLGAALTRTKVIYTEHGRFYPEQRRLKRLIVNPFLCLLTDYVTAISYATRDALVQFEKFPVGKIHVVYNGIDERKYRGAEEEGLKESLGICDSAEVLGTVARLDAIKNQSMMLKALKIVHQTYPNTYLIIVGDGPERKRLESQAAAFGLSQYVIFAGFKVDAHRFYRIMDIFLLTSFSEGTAMTLLEAMASGVACIATDVGGNREILEDNVSGVIVPSDDELTLAERICQLINDKKVRQKIGEAGTKRFYEKFTVDKMVKAYEKMYSGDHRSA